MAMFYTLRWAKLCKIQACKKTGTVSWQLTSRIVPV